MIEGCLPGSIVFLQYQVNLLRRNGLQKLINNDLLIGIPRNFPNILHLNKKSLQKTIHKLPIRRPQQPRYRLLEFMLATLHHLDLLDLLVHEFLELGDSGWAGLDLVEVAVAEVRAVAAAENQQACVGGAGGHAETDGGGVPGDCCGLVPEGFLEVEDM